MSTKEPKKKERRLFPYISVLIVAVLAIVGVLLFAKAGNPQVDSGEQTQNSGESMIVDAESSTPGQEETVAAVDTYGVNGVMDQYFQAKLEDDADTLNKIVDTKKKYKVSDLADESQFITKFDNFKTYVLPGYDKDTFIVYVTYDIYFKGINTGAPALNHFVVKKDQDGNFMINDQKLSKEYKAYLKETEKTELVQNLIAEVDANLAEACEENVDLKYLMALLKGKEVEETTVAPTKQETKKTSEAAKTETKKETTAETTKAKESTKAKETTKASVAESTKAEKTTESTTVAPTKKASDQKKDNSKKNDTQKTEKASE